MVRSEQKFAQRRKAERHMNYTGWKIIRPDIVRQCYVARRHLLDVAAARINSNVDDAINYSERDIPGIGANHMTEKGRIIGVEAYSDLIQQFALQGLYTFLVEACETCTTTTTSLMDLLTREFLSSKTSNTRDFDTSTSVGWPSFPWNECYASSFWPSQRCFLLLEFPLTTDENIGEWITNLLEKFITIEVIFSDRVRQCKQRDDSRGAVTIPGYEESHVLVHDDAVVISIQNEVEQLKRNVASLLQKLETLIALPV